MFTELTLERLRKEHEAEYGTYVLELVNAKEPFVPAALEYGRECNSFDDVIVRYANCEKGIDLPEGFVPDTTLFLMGGKRHMLGALNIRHRLTPVLKKFGGHIGYGIRPKYRREGYGYHILKLGLIEAHKLGINDVRITCGVENIGSEKIILACGGESDGEEFIENEGKAVKQFWIKKRQENSCFPA